MKLDLETLWNRKATHHLLGENQKCCIPRVLYSHSFLNYHNLIVDDHKMTVLSEVVNESACMTFHARNNESACRRSRGRTCAIAESELSSWSLKDQGTEYSGCAEQVHRHAMNAVPRS